MGGLYFILNAILSQISCFVAAALYSAYADVGTEGLFHAGSNSSASNSTALFDTTLNGTANYTSTDFSGASSKKIDDFTLFVSFATLSVVSILAMVGLLLTIKREFLGTFFSLQTGCEFSRSYFLDHTGDDGKRSNVFYMNERHWQSIRALVRAWVQSMHASWKRLAPAWFTADVRARIPDDCMPAEAIEERNAPGGRRQTLGTIGLMRRLSLAPGSPEAGTERVLTPALGEPSGNDVGVCQ